MSQDPVQIVTKLLESFARKDIPTLQSLFTADCEWSSNYPAHLPFSGPARGAEGILARIGRMAESFESSGSEVKTLIGQGDAAVLIVREQLRARATGKVTENTSVLSVKVRDGQIVSALALCDSYAVSEALRPDEAPKRPGKPAGKAKKNTLRAAPKGKASAGKNTLKASGKGSARGKKKTARARA